MERDRSFTEVLGTLGNALCATHLAARPLWTRSQEEDVAQIAKDIHRSALDFSHVPLVDMAKRVTHVLYREDIPHRPTGAARLLAKPLDAVHTIPANASVAEVAERIQTAGFLLVHPAAESGRFDGIINHADLAKLPLRIWLFAAFAEIEDRLRSRLSDLVSDDSEIGKNRLFGPAHLPARYRLHFIDLMQVAWRKRRWFKDCGAEEASRFFHRLNGRRNAVVHALDGALTPGWRAVVGQLKTTVEDIRRALDELSEGEAAPPLKTRSLRPGESSGQST